jgi:hypothetical protein
MRSRSIVAGLEHEADEPLAQRLRARGLRPDLQRQPAEVVLLGALVGRLEHPSHDLGERQVVDVVGDHLAHRPHRLLGDRDDHVLLAREVAVHRAGREAARGEEVLHRRRVKAVGGEEAPRGVEDLAAARLEVLVGDAGHRAEV